MTLDANVTLKTNDTEPSPFYMLEAIYKALCVDKNASVNIVGADVKVDVVVAPEVQVKGDPASPLPTTIVGSLTNVANLGTTVTVGQQSPVSPGNHSTLRLHLSGSSFDVQIFGWLNQGDATSMIIPTNASAVPSGPPSTLQITDVTSEGVYDYDVQGYYTIALNVVSGTNVTALGVWLV